jgi:hypothetical protein
VEAHPLRLDVPDEPGDARRGARRARTPAGADARHAAARLRRGERELGLREQLAVGYWFWLGSFLLVDLGLLGAPRRG